MPVRYEDGKLIMERTHIKTRTINGTLILECKLKGEMNMVIDEPRHCPMCGNEVSWHQNDVIKEAENER